MHLAGPEGSSDPRALLRPCSLRWPAHGPPCSAGGERRSRSIRLPAKSGRSELGEHLLCGLKLARSPVWASAAAAWPGEGRAGALRAALSGSLLCGLLRACWWLGAVVFCSSQPATRTPRGVFFRPAAGLSGCSDPSSVYRTPRCGTRLAVHKRR